MATWNPTLIAAVGSQAYQFPNIPVAHWEALRNSVDGVRDLLNDVNDQMTAVEQSPDLKPSGITRQRAAIAKTALGKLKNFAKLDIARHQVDKRVATLKSKTQALLDAGAAKTPGDAAIAVQIRDWLSRQGGNGDDAGSKRLAAAVSKIKDPRFVSAILEAPAYLSGLTDDQVGIVRAQALDSTDPSNEARAVSNALDVAEAAVKRASNMIAERAGMRADPDGQWRHQTEKPVYTAA